ncbi:MAG TPA: NAD(P)/FAD-dependent oxidoreductase [Steroidobacteraceae bacterium]|nr:NAD(P)/FAD-dependent oxidoreductase [Steroidobacteraceae bacterium]
MSVASFDCIVIGAGHNGLVCATYLARSGRTVLLLEAAEQVGGAALTREFVPGFRVSACAHLLHMMPAALLADLHLHEHGLALAARDLPTTALAPGGTPLRIDPLDAPALAAHCPRDVAALGAYRERMRRHARALHAVLQAVPPRMTAESWADRLALLRLAWQLRRLGRAQLRDLLRIGAMSVWDLLEDSFECEQLRGALALDAVLGTNFGPRSPGTVFTLLHRMAASGSGLSLLAQPVGGLGALSDALARSARQAGAVIRTGAEVERIRVVNDRAAGVVLRSGEEIRARTIVSSADPKTTFLGLLGSEHLDSGFVRRITHVRSGGLAAKLHLALARLPQFAGVPQQALAGRLLLAPSLQYIERAFNHAKYREFSPAPILEVTVPTVNDPSLAPSGKHVLSAIVQYVPYDPALAGPAARTALTDAVLGCLQASAPGIVDSVEGLELLTPQDIEREFRVRGGHWHHAELALDQFFWMRPVVGAAQYRTPVAGLYLCGAGCHPGGGVMGIAGRNAAQQVTREAA